MSAPPTILVATDLTDASDAALQRAHAHAQAISAKLVVCHVLPDVLRHHPLTAARGENDVVLTGDLTKRAADVLTEQVRRVVGLSPDDYRAAIETGNADEEIVRIAEAEHAALVVVGAKPRHGVEKVLGHVAERVVRYAHASVLVARAAPRTNKILVATDFTSGAQSALRVAATLMRTVGVEGTLLHVMQLPNSALASITSPLGSPWIPPAKAAVEQLEALGKSTLDGLAAEYGFAHAEQVEGTPAHTIAERANAIGAEMIIMGSRGRSGLARLVLGSTAEKVIRTTACSVLVARDAVS